jgi:hypothetical protein
MHEIVPGIWHWTAFHEGIGSRVSSYFVQPAGALVDPMLPETGGLAAFDAWPEPQQILLTNRHHLRHAERFRERFGCLIRAPSPGMHEFGHGPGGVQPYAFGDQLAPGITAIEIGAICPDEAALHIGVGDGAIAFADGLVRSRGTLGFVPDYLLGDDPAQVKAGLKQAYHGLLELDFDHLLFAHGEPLIGGGKAALREFVTSPVDREQARQSA